MLIKWWRKRKREKERDRAYLKYYRMLLAEQMRKS